MVRVDILHRVLMNGGGCCGCPSTGGQQDRDLTVCLLYLLMDFFRDILPLTFLQQNASHRVVLCYHPEKSILISQADQEPQPLTRDTAFISLLLFSLGSMEERDY